ncbi:hypothetical protein V9T40_001788 [Parthenolecanium corni]|uniref:Uncharacterized protein n=1 Tax=Parthenolecanium corni TaxID=536013 RepID=A0AAN9Y4Q5_9HEMI
MIADKEGLLEELIRPKDGVVNQCIQEGVIVSSICCTFGVMEIRKTEAENLAPEPPKKHDQEFRAIVEQLTVQVKRIVKAERQSTICGSSCASKACSFSLAHKLPSAGAGEDRTGYYMRISVMRGKAHPQLRIAVPATARGPLHPPAIREKRNSKPARRTEANASRTKIAYSRGCHEDSSKLRSSSYQTLTTFSTCEDLPARHKTNWTTSTSQTDEIRISSVSYRSRGCYAVQLKVREHPLMALEEFTEYLNSP